MKQMRWLWLLPAILFPVMATAGQWGNTGTGYPSVVDSANPRTNVGGGSCSSAATTNICAEWLNDWQNAEIAAQTELGTNPKGTSASVKEKIAGLRTYSGATADTINIVGDRVGIGTATPDPFALLDLSSTTKAVLVPRMTTAQKAALTAVNGMIVYDTTLGQYQFFQAGAWTGLGSGAPTDAQYWVSTAHAGLTAERDLGALTTGLVLNTVTAGVGVPSTYGGALCTAQFVRSLNASGGATCASVSLSADVTGDLPFANLTPATAASKLLGRGSAAGAGDFEEITLGTGLTMTGTTLSSGGGGSSITAATATVAANEATGSTSFTDLTTSGPSVTLTVGPSGILEIITTALMYESLNGTVFKVDFALSGGNTRSASDLTALIGMREADTGYMRASAVTLLTGLTQSSTTITLKYRVSAGTGNFMDRTISVKTW